MEENEFYRIQKNVFLYKKIIDFLDYKIMIEKERNKINIFEIKKGDKTIYETVAYIWKKKEINGYKRIRITIESTDRYLKRKEIKWLLLLELYKKVINFSF